MERDRVIKQIVDIVGKSHFDEYETALDILSIPELAILADDQSVTEFTAHNDWYGHGCKAQRNMLNEGFKKVVKKEKK